MKFENSFFDFFSRYPSFRTRTSSCPPFRFTASPNPSSFFARSLWNICDSTASFSSSSDCFSTSVSWIIDKCCVFPLNSSSSSSRSASSCSSF